jgi:hypothetical protein
MKIDRNKKLHLEYRSVIPRFCQHFSLQSYNKASVFDKTWEMYSEYPQASPHTKSFWLFLLAQKEMDPQSPNFTSKWSYELTDRWNASLFGTQIVLVLLFQEPTFHSDLSILWGVMARARFYDLGGLMVPIFRTTEFCSNTLQKWSLGDNNFITTLFWSLFAHFDAGARRFVKN